MLSVTGANFTPDNGSVVCAALAVLMQTRTWGPVPSVPCWALGAELLGRVGSVLPNPQTGKSLCQCFSPVKDSLQAHR